jgi:hypothetical protein
MIEHVIHILYFGSAVAIAIVPFQHSRSRAAWARWIFFAIAGLFLVLAVCGVALDFQLWNPSTPVRSETEHYLEGVRGFLLGCVFVLLVSGQLFGKKIVKDEVAV